MLTSLVSLVSRRLPVSLLIGWVVSKLPNADLCKSNFCSFTVPFQGDGHHREASFSLHSRREYCVLCICPNPSTSSTLHVRLGWRLGAALTTMPSCTRHHQLILASCSTNSATGWTPRPPGVATEHAGLEGFSVPSPLVEPAESRTMGPEPLCTTVLAVYCARCTKYSPRDTAY
jgi:hypothetical protein